MPIRRPAAQNSRREGFELTKQRDLTPVVLGALTGAVICHVIAYFYLPDLVQFGIRDQTPQGEVEEKIERLIVRKPPPEPEREPEPEELQTAEEIVAEERREIEEEIDLLDVEYPELTMAPGETNIPVAAPDPIADEPLRMDELAPEQLDMSALLSAEQAPSLDAIADLEPVNSNDVVVAAAPKELDLQELDAMTDSDLRETARESQGKLPDDTRSLGELMGLSSLGENSGVARIGTDVLFGFNECELKSAARVSLLQLAALIYKNPDTRFIIEGHTDSIGGDDYNDLLSLQRAAAVREWLRGNHVPTKRVYIRACGSRSHLAPASGDRAEEALNRRVEIHMRAQDEELPPGCVPDTYRVDLKTKVRTQLLKGTRAPAAGASINPFEKAQKTQKAQKAQKAQKSSKSKPKQSTRGRSSKSKNRK